MTEQPVQAPLDSDAENPIQSSQSNDAAPTRRSRALVWFKKIVPWAIAAAILYALFSGVPMADAWQAMRAARLELFIPAMMVSVLLWFLIDSAAFAFLFTRFNAKLDWSEARSLRGMTYLVTPINWNLGTAAVILHLRSSKQIGALASTSSMAFYQMIDGLVLISYVGLGALLLPSSPETESLRRISLGIVMFLGVLMWISMASRPRWGWLSRIRNFGFFRSHQAATPRDLAVLCLMKSIYFAVFIGVYWLGCLSFDIDLPLEIAVAATPAILVVGSLPITPAGLGTQQAAMVYFFAPYGDEASILALGLTFPVALILFRLILGLPYLKDLPKLRKAMAEQKAQS